MQVPSSTSWDTGTSLLWRYSHGRLLSSAGRVNALGRRVDLSLARVNSVPQGWFGHLPLGLSVEVCVCHQDGLSRLAQSRRRIAGKELTAKGFAKERG